MAHVVLSFLGAGQRQQTSTTVGERQSAYREADYLFDPDDQECHRTSIFGLALLSHLQNENNHADKFVVLGTSGSAWEDLARQCIGLEMAAERDALYEAARKDQVRPADLDPFREVVAASLKDRFGVREAVLDVIDYVKEPKEQAALIESIARHVAPGDRVTLDVTHGLRYLPLLGAFAALVVGEVKRAEIAQVYYGALDLTPRKGPAETPVLKLSGLLRIADWLAALQLYDATGDYGEFADLLQSEGASEEAVAALRDAAFREQIGDFTVSARCLGRFHRQIRWDDLEGPGRLFIPEMLRRLPLAAAPADRYQRLKALAKAALQRDDSIRAAQFGYEAAMTRIVEQFGEAASSRNSDEIRKEYDRRYTEWSAQTPARIRDAHSNADRHGKWELLRQIRNRTVHLDFDGKPVRGKLESALSSEQKCLKSLKECLETLLPDDRRELLIES